jgi:hypothetical protein
MGTIIITNRRETMARLMSVTEFVREHAPEMDVSTVRFYIKKYGIQPAELRDRCRGGWLYKEHILLNMVNRRESGFTEKAKKAKERKNRKEELERERNPSWVPFPIGTKIRVTNCAGRKTVGIFIGYKGSVLARLQLQKEETVFAMDADVEEVGEDIPIDVDDEVLFYRKKRRDIYSVIAGEE